MALKTDRKTLTKELKNAVKQGRNFVYAPSGDKAKPAVLKLSKKKIPIGERSSAKSDAGASKVYYGSCLKKGGAFIFQSAIKPPGSLGKMIKKSIRELTDYVPPKVEAVFMADFVELDFVDEDDLQEMASARRKSVTAAAKWLSSAKPEGSAAIAKIIQEGNNKFDAKKWEDAVATYDKVLSAVAAARQAASNTKVGEPEQEGLKRKKLGEDYAGEDKKTGWRAPDLSDQQLSRGALLKLAHQSATYKHMDTDDFMALVKSKDPGVMKVIAMLEAAIEKGDQAAIEKISKIKNRMKEERKEIQDSDRVTTKYYTPQQRKKHGLKVGKDGLLYDSNGDLFDERKGFVLDPDTGNLVVFKAKAKEVGDGKKKTTHHSSPLAGGDVAGAGHIEATDGRVEMIDDASGHYKPDASFTLQTLKQLEKLGAKLVDDTIVDEDGDEVSKKKARNYKLVKAYEQERKKQLKKLLTHWKSEVEKGNVKKGKPPELPPYDPNIAAMRDKLLKAGVGPSQKSTKVKLQGKKGLSQEQFDETKGDVKAINKILKQMTGKKDLVSESIGAGVLNSRPALNLHIGELLQRTLSKEQMEQTGGNEDQIRKKDVLNKEIKKKGRKSALARALKELGSTNVIAGASKILGIPEAQLKLLREKTLENTLLGVNNKQEIQDELQEIMEELEERKPLEKKALRKLNLKQTDPGVKEGIADLSPYFLGKIIEGSLSKHDALDMMGLGDATV